MPFFTLAQERQRLRMAGVENISDVKHFTAFTVKLPTGSQ
jgi:hypothetical protein